MLGQLGSSTNQFDFNDTSYFKRGFSFGFYKGQYTVNKPQNDTADGVFIQFIYVDGNAPLGFTIAQANYGSALYYRRIWGANIGGWQSLL